jgi:hypothetical protein
VMPTVNNRKHNDAAAMALWRSSAVCRFLQDQVHSDSCRSPTRGVRNISPGGKGKLLKTAETIEELVDILSNFKREQGAANPELTDRIQGMTSDLKQFILSSQVSNALNKDIECDKFSHALYSIESIITDTGLQPSIRAALIRKELREVGIFTWNSDLEGMIFGYGEPVHDQLVVASIPQSMKDFCMDNEEFLSGAAFERYKYYETRDYGVDDRKEEIAANIDDIERLSYLIQMSPTGSLETRDISLRYRMVFGSRFRGNVGGVVLPFNVIVERLKASGNIRVTSLATPSSGGAEYGGEAVEQEDHDSDDEEYDELIERAKWSKVKSKGSKRNQKFDSAQPPSPPPKSADRTPTPNSKIGRGRGPAEPLPDIKFEWSGATPVAPHEHAAHVFHDPAYWRFVGQGLHGGKDRAGMWKRLPWSVLKDLITTSKGIKIPDNRTGKHMTVEDVKKYGRSSSNCPLHIGVQDLLDWMEDMETKGIVPIA